MNRFSLIALMGIMAGAACASAEGLSLPPLKLLPGKPKATYRPLVLPKADGDTPPPAPEPSPDPTPVVVVQPLLVVPDYIAEPGEAIVVKPTTNCKHVQYYALDKGLTIPPLKEYLNDKYLTDLILWGITPGQYRILAYSSLNDIQTPPTLFTITIQGEQPPPQPQPNPQPQPQPDPTPKAAKLWIALIYDSTNVKGGSTDPLAAILNNISFWNSLKAQGHEYQRIDSQKDPVGVAKFQQQIAANGGTPCVVIMDASNAKILNQGDFGIPKTTNPQSAITAMQAMVAKYTK